MNACPPIRTSCQPPAFASATEQAVQLPRDHDHPSPRLTLTLNIIDISGCTAAAACYCQNNSISCVPRSCPHSPVVDHHWILSRGESDDQPENKITNPCSHHLASQVWTTAFSHRPRPRQRPHPHPRPAASAADNAAKPILLPLLMYVRPHPVRTHSQPGMYENVQMYFVLLCNQTTTPFFGQQLTGLTAFQAIHLARGY